MLQSCSQALLPLSTLCLASICQPHDLWQAKGNHSCQEQLGEFSLLDFVVQQPFFFLQAFCTGCTAGVKTAMHIYVLQADPASAVPLQ